LPNDHSFAHPHRQHSRTIRPILALRLIAKVARCGQGIDDSPPSRARNHPLVSGTG
jgi:hypothetical protein